MHLSKFLGQHSSSRDNIELSDVLKHSPTILTKNSFALRSLEGTSCYKTHGKAFIPESYVPMTVIGEEMGSYNIGA